MTTENISSSDMIEELKDEIYSLEAKHTRIYSEIPKQKVRMYIRHSFKDVAPKTAIITSAVVMVFFIIVSLIILFNEIFEGTNKPVLLIVICILAIVSSVIPGITGFIKLKEIQRLQKELEEIDKEISQRKHKIELLETNNKIENS